MAKQFTLGKEERMKSRKQIEHLFNEGEKFSVHPFRIFYSVSSLHSTHNSQLTTCFGIGVSSRNFKKAVDRNRIKRLGREAWRTQNKALKEKLKTSGKQLNVFFIYTAKELPDFKTVNEKVVLALKKLSAKTDENISSNS
jgi:ribonuclease P protein component